MIINSCRVVALEKSPDVTTNSFENQINKSTSVDCISTTSEHMK